MQTYMVATIGPLSNLCGGNGLSLFDANVLAVKWASEGQRVIMWRDAPIEDSHES